MPLVGIILGSKSDESYAQDTQKVLDSLKVSYELTVCSAHRTPDRLREYCKGARDRGIEVLIALAGGSAALPGAAASWTTLPVIGVPLPTSDLKGVDSLYTIAQMPPGIPVACVATGTWGARNAAYLAAAILGNSHTDVRKEYDAYRESLGQEMGRGG
ncbi:MAG: 5-(carboxyamino)imidazole ribonucleotide mutase [Dehalococcoidia bacterium]|nr:5-(carboxyamino)imidazole ribonucleotide mutase [Dehalococcoidia bacterium]